jgi:hypothetical protein
VSPFGPTRITMSLFTMFALEPVKFIIVKTLPCIVDGVTPVTLK